MRKVAAVVLLGAVLLILVLRVMGSGDAPGGDDGNAPGRDSGASPSTGEVGRPGEPAGDRERAVTSPEQVTVPEQPGGGVPVGEVDIRVEEGRTNGQREFAGDFVAAVYGYTGSDGEEYLALVGEYVESDIFYASPGGSQVRERAGRVSSLPDGAAALEGYSISYGPEVGEGVPGSAAEAFATEGSLPGAALQDASLAELEYAVGEGYDGSGEVTGGVSYYAQDLILVPGSGGARWQVLAASAPERIPDPDAGAPAPGAPKVGEPGPHEHGAHDAEQEAGQEAGQ